MPVYSYEDMENDFEEEEVDSVNENATPQNAFKSPLNNSSVKSKKNLKANASLSSIKEEVPKKNRRTSSLVKTDDDQNELTENKFMVKSKSKQRNMFGGDPMRSSVNPKGDTKLPKMKSSKMYQSYSDSKYQTQFGGMSKLALKGIKKPAMMVIEESILAAKTNLEKIQTKRDKVNQSADEDSKLLLLTDESNVLRNELKVLNNCLNMFIEEMRLVKLKAGTKKNKADPAELEERKRIVKEREIENYDKMTKNLMNEHTKLSKRVELVSNPQYVFDLREKVEEMKNYVKELKNNKKALEKNQRNRDKQLNYMLNKGGEIGHLKKMNDTQNELTVTRNQMLKIDKKLDKLQETKAANEEQIKSLTEKLANLQSMAEKSNIDLEKYSKEVEKKNEYEGFASSKRELTDK